MDIGKKRNLTLSMDSNLIDRAKQYCQSRSISLSYLFDRLLLEFLNTGKISESLDSDIRMQEVLESFYGKDFSKKIQQLADEAKKKDEKKKRKEHKAVN